MGDPLQAGIVAFVCETKTLTGSGVLALVGLVWISPVGGRSAARWFGRQRDMYRAFGSILVF